MNLNGAPVWLALVVAICFGGLGYVAVRLGAFVCRTIEPFEDGPKPGRPPTRSLIAGAACVGGLLALQLGVGSDLVIPAIVILALVASFYSDVICGIIPDYFTLLPLGIVVLLRVLLGDWTILAVGAAVTLCFGLAAYLSKGRGMGWGDVKLVALGAVVLGDRSLLAYAAACLAAVIVASVRKRRAEPLAFAPYLACAIAIGLSLPIFPRTGL